MERDRHRPFTICDSRKSPLSQGMQSLVNQQLVNTSQAPSAEQDALVSSNETTVTHVTAENGVTHVAAENGTLVEVQNDGSSLALPVERSRASDVVFKGAISEDMDGGAVVAPTVSRMWSNIPNHVRASFTTPAQLDDAPRIAQPWVVDTLAENARGLAATYGVGPAHWSKDYQGVASYYDGKIPLAPYKQGQTAAYNYPMKLIPREVAFRMPLEMMADPVFQTSDPDQAWKMRGQPLFNHCRGKTTLLVVFSNQPLSGLVTGLRAWMDRVGKEFLSHKDTQALKLHAAEGWFSRRTAFITKFYLRRQVPNDELFKTFVYKGRWKWEYVRALHLYDKELPVVLLIDSLGYIRWHAVGLPTEEATDVLRTLSRSLARAPRSYI